MPLSAWQRNVVDAAGNVLPFADITVRDQDTSGLIQLYSDFAGATPIGNPIAADAEGFVRFYAESGRYQIEAESGAFSRIWENVKLGVPEEDFDELVERYFYRLTDAEDSVGAVPLDYYKAPGDITRYGAVSGGNVALNTTAWQKAVAQAQAPNNDAASVFIPFSRLNYEVNAGATVTNIPIRIYGEHPNWSAIYASNNITLLTIEDVQASHGMILEDVGFGSTAATKTTPNILIKNSSFGQIVRCMSFGNGYGVKFETGASSPFSCFSWTIEDSLIAGNAIINIDCGDNTNHLQMRNVTFGGGAPIGIRSYNSGGLNIVGGDCEGTTNAAVLIDVTSPTVPGVFISGVDFETNDVAGAGNGVIQIGLTNAVYAVTIIGCIFHNSGAPWWINPQRCVGLTVIGCGSNILSGSGDAINPSGVLQSAFFLAGNTWQATESPQIIKGTLGYGDTWAGNHANATIPITYSASMTPDVALGNLLTIVITDGSAFTVNNPTNTREGMLLTITVINVSGGAHGTATMGAAFKLAGGGSTLPAIATGNNRSFTFRYRIANWLEVSRNAADVPN